MNIIFLKKGKKNKPKLIIKKKKEEKGKFHILLSFTQQNQCSYPFVIIINFQSFSIGVKLNVNDEEWHANIDFKEPPLLNLIGYIHN